MSHLEGEGPVDEEKEREGVIEVGMRVQNMEEINLRREG